MPLPFEKWGSDRRKKDDKKDGKKDKKKKKSKEEELLEREVEELKRQLIEERQNTRREKLNSARLQKELTESKKDTAMKETLAQALVKQEQEQRLRTEQRLSNVLTENEAFKAQLVHLRSSNLTVMEKADQETQEKLQNGPVMTEAGPNNNGEVEPRVVDEESIVQALQKEKTLLLERLRVLESSNSAMVLEGEKQQEVYDRCLDEVASQVVQALLIQRELKEECTKLRNRVEELEIHNRQLRHLFEQEIWMQKQNRESCSSEKGSSHQSLPDNSCANSGTVNGHLHNGPSAVFKHTFFSQTEMHQWPHHLLTSHLNGNNGPSVLYPGAFHRQVSLPNACFSGSLPPGLSTNLVLHNGPTVAGPTPFHKSLPSSLGMDGYEEFAGGGECLGSSDVISDLTSFGPSPTDFSGNHPYTGCDAKNVARKTQSLPTTPLTQRSATYHRHLRNQTTFEFTENHNYLSDKYTKPYVHAPLDYAQSLLHELQEIGASVKSFESLTLEPRSNPPQKRKSFGDLERTPQPQKLVKGHGFDDCLRSNCLSNSAENADTFSLEDFPPDGMGSITSGESIETAYERIIPSPEKSPQKNNMLVPAVQVNDALAVIHVQGDVLFDIDENLLENDNQNGELLASAFSAFSSPIKQKQEAGTENDQWGSENTIEKTKEGNGCEEEEKQVKAANEVRDGTNKSSVCDDSEINKLYPMTTGVSERKDSTLFPNASSSSNIEVSPSSGTSIPQAFDLHDVRGLENIEINRSSPLWKIEADQYEEEEQPPLLPPRTNLISRSFESISDEVFMADNSPGDMEKLQREVEGDGDETKRTAPPELPPKPMWMRIGDISLSPDSACEDLIEPPPVPERRPIEPEGQECLSWQWRESYDDTTSEMETTDDAVKPENRTLWSEAADKISETDVELRRLISSESEPEEEGVDYLAMWKAREKSPSWKTCVDTDCSVDVKTVTQSTSASTVKTNVVQSGKDNLTVMQPAAAEEKEISNIEKEKPAVAPRQGLLSAQTDDKEKSASTPMIEVNVRKESLGKGGSDSKLVKGAQKKHKSSIPLFKSKKDASRKGQSVKEKSVVMDIVSTIKAVMDSSSKGGEKFKSGNPLRRSFRSKSQKPEPLNGKKSNGHCPKSIPEVKGKKMPAPARIDKGVLKLPQVLSKQPKVPNNIDPAANEKPPLAKSTKQSSIPKVQKGKPLTGKPSNHTADKLPSGIPRKLEITARTNLSDDDDAKLKGSEPQNNTASVISIKEKDSAKERERATPTKGEEEKTKLTSNIQLEEYMLDKQAPQNLKWELQDRTPSKGSLNLELSESEFSKSRRSSVESLGSLGSFTVEGVPFIDEPGTSPDQETVREIQELSKQFSNLSNGSISQEGPSPLKADWEIDEMEKNKPDSASSVPPQESEQLVGKKSRSAFVDEKDVDDIKKGKLVRDFDLVNYNMNILASRAACTLPALGKNCSDPNLSRSKVKSLSRGHSPPERPEKLTQSDSDLQGARGPKDPSSLGLVGAPKKMIQVPLVNGEIFDTCDEVVAMDENGEGSLENGGEHEAQLSEKERATLLDSLFETDSDEDRDDGSCSQDASELASSDSHPDEKEFLRLLEDKGDAKRQVVRQITHNRVSLMHVDICSVYNRFGDKERQALSSFDFLEKVLNQEIDGENSYFEDEMNNGTKRTQSQTDFTSSSILQLHPNLHLSNLTRPYMEDTQGGDGQVSPFAANHELTNTSMSSSLSTGSLSS